MDAVETPEVVTVAAVKRAKRLKKKKSVSFSSTIDDVGPSAYAPMRSPEMIKAFCKRKFVKPSPPYYRIAAISARNAKKLIQEEDTVIQRGFIQQNQFNEPVFISSATLGESLYPFMNAIPDSKLPIPPHLLPKYSHLFEKEAASTLPQHRSYDCSIDLEPGAQPPYGRVYNLSVPEDGAMQIWLRERIYQTNLFRSLLLLLVRLASLLRKRTGVYVYVWITVP